ncbi:HAD-IC family P-type ATPase [Actinomyces radicidentis]|uniref:HAD-IC family P-type ATPase n=1 Tax=Actinomyces radicidentis TaxID=111015 RepID=UPI0028F161E3|nr:HAD-IC family P-type ATPase [Actinomyces radicidentis]
MTHGRPTSGLSSAEVAERVREGRTNEFRTRTSRSGGQILRANVFTIFNAIITTALVLTLVFGHWADALFGFVLVLNTATGTLAEIRAKRALDRLSVLDAPVAHVIRDGRESDVEVGAVVLDDVLRLKAGEQVPADAAVLQVDGLEVDESILTGESDSVRPEVGATVMSGTTVTSGSALVRATAVGADAYAHRLATEARRYSVVRSELQEGTNRILTWISWVIVPVGLLVLWSQMRLNGSVSQSLSSGEWRVALVAAVASVVGMVPQGLVLLTSVNFATASLKLARQDVLVQELPAVEVLARVDTLCLDKTGTLTTGRITMREALGADGEPLGPGTGSESGPDALAGDLREPLLALTGGSEPNATAEAVLTALTGTEVTGSTELRLLPGVSAVLPRTHSAVAFSSRRKWSGTVLDGEAWVMGAPEIVLDAADGAAALLERARALSEDGVRVVALAHGGTSFGTAPDGDAALPDGLTAAGLVELTEEVRPDAEQTLAYFREQGVMVKVISGDNPVTVAAVARRAGVQGPDGAAPVALDARELPTEVSDPERLERLAAALDGAQVLGRVTPEQKKAVVQALHHRSRTVAMTGDGVNDSLALKEADLGIAMGNGAPATKAVARMVLLSGEFSALPGVVAEGRRVMANTERIASLFLAKTVYASLIAVVVAITAISYPFQPRQLTIVSSLTIGIPAFVLALAPNSQRYRAGFLPRVLRLAVPAGLVAGTTTLMTRQWLEMTGAASEQVTTGATLVLVIAGLWLLTLTAKPLLGWRLGIILLMAGAAVLGVLIPVVREFFLLAWPTWRTWTAIAVGGGAAVAGIQALAVARWVLRLQDRVGEHEERRATREG